MSLPLNKLLSVSIISGFVYTFSILNLAIFVFKSIKPIKSTNSLYKSLYPL